MREEKGTSSHPWSNSGAKTVKKKGIYWQNSKTEFWAIYRLHLRTSNDMSFCLLSLYMFDESIKSEWLTIGLSLGIHGQVHQQSTNNGSKTSHRTIRLFNHECLQMEHFNREPLTWAEIGETTSDQRPSDVIRASVCFFPRDGPTCNTDAAHSLQCGLSRVQTLFLRSA